MRASTGVTLLECRRWRHQHDARHAGADADQGVHQRHARGEQRTERDDQHQQRDQHADAFGRSDVRRSMPAELAAIVQPVGAPAPMLLVGLDLLGRVSASADFLNCTVISA